MWIQMQVNLDSKQYKLKLVIQNEIIIFRNHRLISIQMQMKWNLETFRQSKSVYPIKLIIIKNLLKKFKQ